MASLNTNIGPERVQVFPQPTGTVQVPGVATSTLGVLISSNLPGAPVNVATPITTLTQLVATFGDYTNILNEGYYAIEGFYNNAGTGSTIWVVNVGAGVQQVETVTAVADTAGSLAGTNWLLSSANNAHLYYVWYSVGGVGTDPAVAGRTGVKVSIATNASATAVGAATATALSALEDFSATSSTGTMTITHTLSGPATTPSDGTPATSFTLATGTPGTTPVASDYIGSATAGTGLRALDNIDVLGLVAVPGLPLSMAYLVHPATIDYAKVVRAEWGATLSTTYSLTTIPQEITKSNTNVLVTSGTVASVASGVVTYGSPYPALTSVTPGMVAYVGTLLVGVVTAVNATAHTVTLTSTSGVVATNTLSIYMPSAVTYKELVVNDPSQSNSWYMNWVLMADESHKAAAGTLLAIDPSCHVAGIMARIDSNTSIGGPSHAAAGVQFAGIAGIAGLTLALSERLDAAPLRLNFINRITSFPGSGNVVYGAYTSDSGTSPQFTAQQQLSQVVRAVQFIKASLEPGLRSFIWENYSPATQSQVVGAILSFLRNNSYLFPAGLPESSQFKVVSVTPTTDQLNQGLLVVTVQVRTNSAVRFIEVDLQYPIPTAA